MDFAIKYLSDPVCPAFGPVRSRVCPFSYMLYTLLQKDFYYSIFSGICQELILHILQIWVLSIVMRKIFQKNFLSVTCKLLLECI